MALDPFVPGQTVVLKTDPAGRAHVDREAVVWAVYPATDDPPRPARLSLACTKQGRSAGRRMFAVDELDKCATLNVEEFRRRQREPKHYGW